MKKSRLLSFPFLIVIITFQVFMNRLFRRQEQKLLFFKNSLHRNERIVYTSEILVD